MGRFDGERQKPRVASRQGETQEVMVGKAVGLFIERHPSFSANPLGDWQELVGENMARYCQPQSLKKKVLMITAHDSVWKYHLELLKVPLLQRINKGRKEPLVEKIVVRVGELSGTAPQLNPALQNFDQSGLNKSYRRKKRKTPSRPLTPEEKAMLKALKDPDLRAAGTRLLKRIPAESDE